MRRIASLIATAVLALSMAACGSAAGGSSGGSGGGSGGTSGGTGGGSTGGSSGGAAAVDGASPSRDVDHATAAPGNSGSDHVHTSDDFDGCKIWFGFAQGSSSTFLVSASKEGIAGHVQWKCSNMISGVDRLRISAHLEHAFTLGGPYTAEPASVTSGGGTNGSGNLFPTTSYCTTDWWRVRVTIGFDETGGGPMTRPDLISESRKVTPDDCNRA